MSVFQKIVCAAALVLYFNSTLLASERIVLRQGLFGSDRAAIKDFFQNDEDLKDDFDPTGRNTEDGLKFTMANIHVGRFDLNGDGVNELFVLIEHMGWCGTIGCPAYVLEKKNGQWQLLTAVDVDQETERPKGYFLSVPENFIYAFIPDCAKRRHFLAQVPAVNAGYRTLYGFQGGRYWNGKEYHSFCLYRCVPECG